MPSGSDLERALSVVAEPSEGLFSTFEAYQADFLKTANEIYALNEITGDALTVEQRTLETLEAQLETERSNFDKQLAHYDDVIRVAEDQLDEAMGTKLAVMSLDAATANMAASILDLQTASQAMDVAEDASEQAQAEHDEAVAYYDAMVAGAKAQLDAALGNTLAIMAVNGSLLNVDASIAELQTAEAAAAEAAAAATQAQAEHEQAVSYYDALLRTSQDQLDEAMGTKLAVMSVKDAIASLASALGTLKSTPKPSASPSQNPTDAYINKLYQDIFGRDVDAPGLGYWKSELASGGVSAEQLAQAIRDGARNEDLKKLRGFAVGTNYVPYDMPAIVHKGERIIPEADNRELMARLSDSSGNSVALLQEVRAQRKENAELRADLKAALFSIAKNTGNTAKSLDRWDADGMPEVREEITA